MKAFFVRVFTEGSAADCLIKNEPNPMPSAAVRVLYFVLPAVLYRGKLKESNGIRTIQA